MLIERLLYWARHVEKAEEVTILTELTSRGTDRWRPVRMVVANNEATPYRKGSGPSDAGLRRAQPHGLQGWRPSACWWPRPRKQLPPPPHQLPGRVFARPPALHGHCPLTRNLGNGGGLSPWKDSFKTTAQTPRHPVSTATTLGPQTKTQSSSPEATRAETASPRPADAGERRP